MNSTDFKRDPLECDTSINCLKNYNPNNNKQSFHECHACSSKDISEKFKQCFANSTHKLYQEIHRLNLTIQDVCKLDKIPASITEQAEATSQMPMQYSYNVNDHQPNCSPLYVDDQPLPRFEEVAILPPEYTVEDRNKVPHSIPNSNNNNSVIYNHNTRLEVLDTSQNIGNNFTDTSAQEISINNLPAEEPVIQSSSSQNVNTAEDINREVIQANSEPNNN
ncbi:hypothetical protein HK099_008029 [Clydaea vesicula]|uniref:Uncharacterized protein n=1 Tax=Clydaea vesicula TaxID=447962 RepID=A0AAD5U858_9FUNG|nr:hypothetical protein HK099_008029 [Clydaea vesicula]